MSASPVVLQSTASSARVLIVDDEPAVRDFLVTVLEDEGYDVATADRGDIALQRLERELFDLVLLDCNLPGIQGLSVLDAARSRQADAQFILMTGFGSVGDAVEAMKLGAYDYVSKPFRMDDLLVTVSNALRAGEVRREVAKLQEPVVGGGRTRIVGNSPALQRMFSLIERVAPTRATVLVTGETGTGKELVARVIHERSDRGRQPFVPVNCSALPETLLESELFGHQKGAFTGAIASRRGLFEEAEGGTLFLDEIATVSPAIQVKLLRVLQEKAVQRVGGPSVPVDFRLVAACNVDLADEVAAGRFREDLYYRLSVFPIAVPSLRERPDDIPLLANAFRERFGREHGIVAPELAPDALRRMVEYAWPGNVRELENFIERAMIQHAGARSLPFDPPVRSGRDRPESDALSRGREEHWSLDRLEREYILSTLADVQGHQSRAAERLGIDRRTLYRKLKQYDAA